MLARFGDRVAGPADLVAVCRVLLPGGRKGMVPLCPIERQGVVLRRWRRKSGTGIDPGHVSFCSSITMSDGKHAFSAVLAGAGRQGFPALCLCAQVLRDGADLEDVDAGAGPFGSAGLASWEPAVAWLACSGRFRTD